MTDYAYSPELPKPGRLNGIDFSDPKLAPMVQMLARNLRQTVRAYSPPQGIALRKVNCETAEGTQVECFVVEPAGAARRSLPGMLYCHGGGFFLPLQPMMLHLAALYAGRLGLRVFLPEYRLLPRHPAPAAFADCLAVWRAMAGRAEELGLEEARLLVYGESAGGALAAGLAHLLRDAGGPVPCGQLLVYPALDSGGDYASRRNYPDAAWPRRSNDSMWRAYLQEGAAKLEQYGEYLVPMRAGSFAGLPPAYIEPQEIDILCDEAAAYAARLRGAGVPVELNCVSGSYHGFDADVENPFVRRVAQRRMDAMARMLHGDFFENT